MTEKGVSSQGNTAVVSSTHGAWWRLALGMTLVLIPLGVWIITLPTFIAANTGQEGSGMFTQGFIGKAAFTSAFGSLLSPLLIGALADRWLSANRIIPVIHASCAFFVWRLSESTTLLGFWLCLLGYFVSFAPSMGLMNVICFRNLDHPVRQFPPIRALNTLSFILGCWLVGYLAPLWFGESIEATHRPMQMAVWLHLAVAVLTFLLPSTPPDRSVPWSLRRAFGWDAIGLLADPGVRPLILTVAIMGVVQQFYQQFANVFLNRMDVSNAAGVLSWGQVTEIVVVLMIPFALRRLGVKWTVMTGVSAWLLRYALLAVAAQTGTSLFYWLAILLHGLAFAFCFIAVQIHVDQLAPPEGRSAAQGLLSTITAGLGTLLGAELVSLCQSQLLTPAGVDPAPYDWHKVWWIAAGVSLIPLVFLGYTAVIKKSANT